MSTPVVNPFANAPVLPFARGRAWISQARSLWWSHFLFFALMALAVLAARWQLDFFDGGVVILLSYLTDAVLFSLVFLGVRERLAGSTASAWSAGHAALHGRVRQVVVSGLWGVPAALCSYLLFSFAPSVIAALMLVLGTNLVGVVSMLLLILAAGYATFMLCMLPVLAGIQIARDPEATFKLGGLWAFRGLRAGWRPLLVVFLTFIAACFVAAAVLMQLFGRLPASFFGVDEAQLMRLQHGYAWPGLFIAVNLFLAMLYPMAHDLLGAADVDLSDEIHTSEDKHLHGGQFVASVLEGAGMALRLLCGICILFVVLYAAFFGMQAAWKWLSLALAAYWWAGSFYQCAPAWRNNGSWGARYSFVWKGMFWAFGIVLFFLNGAGR